MTVAVLFARADSIYKTMPGCDVWDAQRDARRWQGGAPIVAHPPCRAWGGFSHWRCNAGPDEKALGPYAVAMVRRWGGVLEHPARSRLWKHCGLPLPGRADAFMGWTLAVEQFWFGHGARKKTWLYIVGIAPREIPPLPIKLGDAPFVIGDSGRAPAGTKRPEISKADRERTPPAFASWLCEIARRVTPAPPDLLTGGVPRTPPQQSQGLT